MAAMGEKLLQAHFRPSVFPKSNHDIDNMIINLLDLEGINKFRKINSAAKKLAEEKLEIAKKFHEYLLMFNNPKFFSVYVRLSIAFFAGFAKGSKIRFFKNRILYGLSLCQLGERR